jgi:hypothetical protein
VRNAPPVRCDEAHLGQGPGRGIGEVHVDGPHEREHACTPQQRDRQVREVLGGLNPGRLELLEDRARAVLAEVERMKTCLQSLGLRREQVLPVREGRSEQRRMMPIHHREPARDVRVHRDVFRQVIAGGEAAVSGARSEKPAVLASGAGAYCALSAVDPRAARVGRECPFAGATE